MTQKRKEGESKNVIGRITALRWEPTHITKHISRSILLHKWYEKALSFKRSRREAIEEFGGRKRLEDLGDMRKKLVLDVLR